MESNTERKKLVEVFIDTDSESESYTSSERSRTPAYPLPEEVLSAEEVMEEAEEPESDSEEELDTGRMLLPLSHTKRPEGEYRKWIQLRYQAAARN